MGIVFNNAIRNAGNMPKIQATTDVNTIVGQLNSLALETTTTILYYWDPSTTAWIPLSVGGTLDFDNCLTNGNSAYGIGPVVIGANYEVNQASFFARDNILSRAIVVNADGIIFGNYDLTNQYYVLAMVSGNPVQSITNSIGGVINLQPNGNAGTIAVTYPKVSGNLYCIDIFQVTLVNGVVTFTPGGENNLILGVGIKTPSGTLGVNYKWAGTGGNTTVTITSLKVNTTTETSDQSTLYVTIAL